MEEYTHRHLLSGWRFKAMIITIIVSMIGYLLFTFWGGWQDVLNAIARVGFFGIVLILALSLVNYWLRFVRWQMFLRVLGHEIPTLPSLRIYIAGFALTTTPGKTGEVLRSIFLKDLGMPYRKSFGAFLAERISDLIAVVLLASLGLWIYPQARPLLLILGILLIMAIIAIQQELWLKKMEIWAKKFMPQRLSHVIEFFFETMLAFRSCYSTKILLSGIFLGVLAWSAEGLGVYFVLQFLGADLSILISQFVYAFSLLIGSITLLPGGLGGAEVTMLELLRVHGVPISLGVATTLVVRLATLWFSVILGILALPKKQNTLTP